MREYLNNSVKTSVLAIAAIALGAYAEAGVTVGSGDSDYCKVAGVYEVSSHSYTGHGTTTQERSVSYERIMKKPLIARSRAECLERANEVLGQSFARHGIYESDVAINDGNFTLGATVQRTYSLLRKETRDSVSYKVKLEESVPADRLTDEVRAVSSLTAILGLGMMDDSRQSVRTRDDRLVVRGSFVKKQ